MTFMRIAIYGLVVLLFSSYEAQARALNSLFQQVQEKLALGYLHEARTQLQELEAAAKDNYTITAIKGLQGYLALQQHDYAHAESLLTHALDQAQKNSSFRTLFGPNNGTATKQPTQAQHYFALAMAQANQVTDDCLRNS